MLSTNSDEIYRTGAACDWQQVIRFRWWSGSQCGSRNF